MNQPLQVPETNSLTPAVPSRRTTLAYRALVFFSLVYFLRPEDFIPGLNALYLGKITGGIALLALIFGVKRKDRGKMPLEGKLLLALLVQMFLTIPTAFWRSGAADIVINKF